MGAAPSLVCPLPSPLPRLSFQPSLYLSQTQAHPVPWTYFLCCLEESGTPSPAICDKL